jgi:hypothetical protein
MLMEKNLFVNNFLLIIIYNEIEADICYQQDIVNIKGIPEYNDNKR